MRKVVVSGFVSLDGVMQAPGGPQEDTSGSFDLGGWVEPLMDDVAGQEIATMLSGKPFDLLLGRRTYEIFAAHWPYAEGGPDDLIAKSFNAITKYVATREGIDLTWGHSVALHDAASDVAKLKEEDGPALVTQGSADLLQTLFASELVDEIRLFTFPIVLGSGKKLFGEGARPAAFRLTDGSISPNGIVIARYERDGAVKTGDFSHEQPTEAEVARRERMRREEVAS